MTNNNRRFSRDQNRMSIESSMTFASLSGENLFNGEELVDVFQGSSNAVPDASMTSFPPVQVLGGSSKLSSGQDFQSSSSGSIFCGKDLADVFQQSSDFNASMQLSSIKMSDTSMQRLSFSSFRRPSRGVNSDKRESFMSSADFSILEDPTQLENTQKAPIAPTAVVSQMDISEVSDNISSSNTNNICSDNCTEDDDRIEYIENIGSYDIICGRNNGAHNWVGNRRFRITIMMNLRKYTDAPTREEKTHVIKSVIELLLDKQGVGARFIKKVGEGMYVRLKDKQIREKVGHAFRDMISLAEKEGGQLEAKCFQ